MTDIEKARTIREAIWSISTLWMVATDDELAKIDWTIAAALKAERDACELIALRWRDFFSSPTSEGYVTADNIARTIRARGEP